MRIKVSRQLAHRIDKNTTGLLIIAKNEMAQTNLATTEAQLRSGDQFRIGKTRRLLETTDEPVDAITYLTGYEDVSSFRRLFKKTTGLSPTAYRRKISLYRYAAWLSFICGNLTTNAALPIVYNLG